MIRCSRERDSISTSCVGSVASSVWRWPGMCWCSVPPQATLSAWAPRQIARIGRPRCRASLTRLSSKASRLGSVGPSSTWRSGGAVGGRVEVGAAGEADAVEAVQQRREVVGAGRRQHHGDRAARVERAQVGHPQRHLRVRGLAVATGRREPRGAHLRGGDANEGAHPEIIDRIATFRTHRWSKLSQLGFARRSGSKLPGAMSSQYIYTMYKLSRTHPPDKTVLKDINLSFFPGAKIGVLGLNGSGKSTLLRIMAGIDKDYRGEAQLAPGATVGLLSQEPELDETKDVRGERRGRRARSARPPGPLQRAVHELLRRDRGRVRPPAGPDRRRRRLGARPDARPGDGRAALSARRGGGDVA